MTMGQLVNPYKYTIYPGFYESCGPQGETLIEYGFYWVNLVKVKKEKSLLSAYFGKKPLLWASFGFWRLLVASFVAPIINYLFKGFIA